VREVRDPVAASYSVGSLPDGRLGAALIASLVFHAIVISLWLPAPRVAFFDPPPVLQVSLRELAVPPAVSPAPSSRASPAPLKEKRIRPAPQEYAPVPLARLVEPPASSATMATEEEPLRAPMSAPERAVAPPAPPPLTVARQALAPRVPMSELLSSYGQAISQALARYKEYPRVAQLQGWQGAVTMRLRVTPAGRLVEAKVHASSGYEVLDRQALAMASMAERLPVPPEGLGDGEIAVLVPVVFRLER
jgi:protein TonB